MDALGIWNAAWIAALASTILYGCYRAVEWRWPERYIGMHETFGLSTQETWVRFLAYRALPTYLIAASCFATVNRLAAPIWVSALIVWLLSIVATHGRVVVSALRKPHTEVNYAGYHIQMMALLSVVIIIAILTEPAWRALVPPPEELLSAIWSGLIVGGLGGFVLVVLKPRVENSPSYGPTYFIARATRDVGLDALDWLFLECVRTGADPIMLKAILVTEVVQRPRWLRRLEGVGARIGLTTTTGAMQMPSVRPLNDRESITKAAEVYAGVWSLRYEDSGDAYSTWAPDLGEMWPVTTRHNGNAAFAQTVSQVANVLVLGSPTHHYTDSPEGGLILELRRLPEVFVLRGVTRSATLRLFEFSGDESPKPVEVAIPGAATGRWRAWQARVSSSAHQIAVVDMPAGRGTLLSVDQGEVSSAEPFDISWDQGFVDVDWTSAEDLPDQDESPEKRRLGPPRRPLGQSALWSSSRGPRGRRHPNL